MGDPGLAMSPPVVQRLQEYDWPGNVRELENVLERLVAFCDVEELALADVDRILSNNIVASLPETREDSLPAHCALAGHTLRELERAAILDTLAACHGNKARAARELGVSEKSIYNKIRRLRISASDILAAQANFGRHFA